MQAVLDIAARVENFEHSTERRAELDARERLHGGLIPSDRAAEAVKRSMRGWGPYQPETPATIRAGIAGVEDARTISAGRLWIDCGRAVSRFTKLPKSERETVQSEAFALLVRWPEQGTQRFDLGGKRELERLERRVQREPNRARAVLAWLDGAERVAAGSLPLRRDWIDADSQRRERGMTEQPSAGAWRALHAAVKQAQRAESVELPEISTDPLDIAAMIEAESMAEAQPIRLADSETPEVLARLLNCQLDAARAMIARAFPHASPAELAAQWHLSPGALAVSLSRGRAAILKRWPNPVDLLDALDVAAASYRAEVERAAIMALLAYRGGEVERAEAESAVIDWRGASAGMPEQALALLSAARAALRRNGQGYGSERAERIAQSTTRTLDAEQRRARRATRRYSSGALAANARAAQREQRRPMARAALAQLTEQRAELAQLLASGSADADRIRALRADVAAGLGG